MIADTFAAVRARIDAAARRAGRDPSEITLVVVTKDVDAVAAREAFVNGATDLAENRVQELRKKQGALSDLDARWHMIGTLQRNKVTQVAGNVVLIHSVDSVSLAEAIGRRARDARLVQDVLLEVNAGDEPSKHGVPPADTPDIVRGLLDIEGLRLRGLMTIAPQGDLDAARRAFRTLRELRDALQREAPGVRELSMGMTEDFEVAIEEGATIVRIGTAIFGARAPKHDADSRGREK